MAFRTDLIAPLTEIEQETLDQMSRYHRFAGFRLRARGLLSLNQGLSPAMIGLVLGRSSQSVYNWAKWWREDGLIGILNGHKGGPPFKLTSVLLDTAVNIAKEEALTLAGIKQRVLALHPDAPDFSTDRLSVGLKKRGLSFKRCRLSLKKNTTKTSF